MPSQKSTSPTSGSTATTSTATPTGRMRSARTMTYDSSLSPSTIHSLHSALTKLRYNLPSPPSGLTTGGTAVDESRLSSAIGGWLHSTITRIGQTRGVTTGETRFTHAGVDIGATTSDDDAMENLYKLTGLGDITVTSGYKERGAQRNAELLVKALERDREYVESCYQKSARLALETRSAGSRPRTNKRSSHPRSCRTSRRSSGKYSSSRYPTTATIVALGAASALTAWRIHQWYMSGEN